MYKNHMISKRLITIFAISIPLFILHGAEEFLTGFYEVDSWDRFIFQPLASLSVHGATFLTFQVMLWILLTVSLVLLLGERSRFYALGLVGVIYVFQSHHLFKALLAGEYYPGLITAALFPVIAVFFWREWFRMHRQVNR